MFRILLGHVDTSLRGGLDVRMGEHERGTEAYSEDRTASSTAPYENSGISTHESNAYCCLCIGLCAQLYHHGERQDFSADRLVKDQFKNNC